MKRAALAYALDGRVLARNALIAALVGSVLNVVNLSALIAKDGWTGGLLLRGAANYLIPFLVSTASAVANRGPRRP